MNLIQILDDLKNTSDNQLAMMVQNPVGSVPSYAVLSEMNRRKSMKENFKARQREEPTVAEEMVAETMQRPQRPQQMPEMDMGIGSMMKNTQVLTDPIPAYGGGQVKRMNRGFGVSSYMSPEEINRLMEALYQRESGGDPLAIGKQGEIGIAQAFPSTAMQPGLSKYGMENIYDISNRINKGLGSSLGASSPKSAKELLKNKEIGKAFGREYFLSLLEKYKGDKEKALAAYNFGFGNVDRGEEIPSSTQEYISTILENAGMNTSENKSIYDSEESFLDTIKRLLNDPSIAFTESGYGQIIESNKDKDQIIKNIKLQNQKIAEQNRIRNLPDYYQFEEEIISPELLDEIRAKETRKKIKDRQDKLKSRTDEFRIKSGLVPINTVDIEKSGLSAENINNLLNEGTRERVPFISTFDNPNVKSVAEQEAIGKINNEVFGDITINDATTNDDTIINKNSYDPLESIIDLKRKPEPKPEPKPKSFSDQYLDLISGLRTSEDERKKLRDQAKRNALMQFGLGLMGNTSTNFLDAIGKAGQPALQEFAKEQDDIRKAIRAEDTAYASGIGTLAKLERQDKPTQKRLENLFKLLKEENLVLKSMNVISGDTAEDIQAQQKRVTDLSKIISSLLKINLEPQSNLKTILRNDNRTQDL